jgi:hypothetical protein
VHEVPGWGKRLAKERKSRRALTRSPFGLTGPRVFAWLVRGRIARLRVLVAYACGRVRDGWAKCHRGVVVDDA